MERVKEPEEHKLSLVQRKLLCLTGVKEVISFDAKEVVLLTAEGILMLRGDDLNITKLVIERGETEVEGRVDSLTYTDKGNKGKRSGESFSKRLFG